MGCSSSTQTQSQESSRPVTKTGVTNGLKQSASDGNASIQHENEICLDKTKQCAVEAKVDTHDKTGSISNLLAGEPRFVMPLASDGASSTCEEGHPLKAESPGSGEGVQAECLKSTNKAKNPGASEDSVPTISAGKNELPGADEKNDKEIEKGPQPIGRFVEIEIFGMIKEIKPPRTTRETEPMETGEGSQFLGMAEEADPLRTMEENKALVAFEETEPQEIEKDIQHVDTDRKTRMLEENDYVGTAGETETSGTLEEIEHKEIAGETKPSGTHEETEHEETIEKTEPLGTHKESEGTAGEAKTSGTLEENEHEGAAGESKPSDTMDNTEGGVTAGENKTLEMMEETEHGGTVGETKPSGMREEIEHGGIVEELEPLGMEKTTLVTGDKSTLQGTVEDNKFPEILGEIQPLGDPEKNDHSRTVRGGEHPETVEKVQLVETTGETKPSTVVEETQENMKPLMEAAREINMNEKYQVIEGETGERVETETHSEIVSEGYETKEEETGEAVDTTAATEIELTNSKK